jgi:diacylglycerol kinase (ATP)
VPRRILIIGNPAAAAGRGQRLLERALPALRDRHLDGDLVYTNRPGHARELARHAAPHYDTVVAAGGDGTAREVASGLLHAPGTRANLAVLPLGTGNDFAVQAGMPDLAHALAALESGGERRLDAVAVRWSEAGRPMLDHALLFAAVGFASRMGRLTSERIKRWFGRSACYSIGFFRALAGFQTSSVQIDADGARLQGPFFHVCAGNSAWAGGGAMHLSPGARMDDGQLALCLIEAPSRWEVAWCFPRLLRGTFPGHPKVRYFPGRRLAVDATPAGELALDGDVLGHTPAVFEVLPAALRVVGLPPASPSLTAGARSMVAR